MIRKLKGSTENVTMDHLLIDLRTSSTASIGIAHIGYCTLMVG